jgi:hypothetical protein
MRREIRDLIESKGIDDDWSTREVVLLELEAAVLMAGSERPSMEDAVLIIRMVARANWNRGYEKGSKQS